MASQSSPSDAAHDPPGEWISVSFTGEESGVAPLSWGQREIWDAMRRQETWMPLSVVEPLTSGTTVARVVEDLRFLMCHYPSMRTRLRIEPHGTSQVVAGAGEVGLEVVDAASDDDPARVAKQVEWCYRNTDYDFEHEWPVRMAVVRHHGEPTHLVWVVCHLVTDAIGAAVLRAEYAAGSVAGSAAALSPLEQARWQRSPAGQRHCHSVLQHWERVLWSLPSRQFAEPAHRSTPRYWHADIASRAAYLAVQTLAARAGVDDAPVLLTAAAVAMARVTGCDPVVLQVVTSNRFRRELAEAVAPINQTALLVVDAVGRPFAEVLDQVRQRSMAAFKNAYYDPVQMDALVERVGRERGEPVDIGCYFNDRRVQPRAESSVSPPDEIRAALSETEFRWVEGQDDKPYEPLFFHVEDASDAVWLTVTVDTHYMTLSDFEACVRGVEEAVVAAALDDPSGAGPSDVGVLEADSGPGRACARPGPDAPTDTATAVGR